MSAWHLVGKNSGRCMCEVDNAHLQGRDCTYPTRDHARLAKVELGAWGLAFTVRRGECPRTIPVRAIEKGYVIARAITPMGIRYVVRHNGERLGSSPDKAHAQSMVRKHQDAKRSKDNG